jgi:hypothetical protein
MLVKI